MQSMQNICEQDLVTVGAMNGTLMTRQHGNGSQAGVLTDKCSIAGQEVGLESISEIRSQGSCNVPD